MKPSMKLINKLNIFYCNNKELNKVTGCKKVETGVNKIKPEVLLVGLPNHVLIKTEKELIKIPKITVNVVDLVGAGDSFVAGFLYGYLNGYSLKKAGMLGVTCSALCIQSIGARTDIPSKEEIETFAIRKKYF